MWTDAYAQAAGAPAGGGDFLTAVLFQGVPILLMFAIMYLLLIRPQQMKQKELDKQLKALKKGDRVVTSGGMFGVVTGVDDHKVVLRIADEVKVEFLKSAVVQVIPEGAKS